MEKVKYSKGLFRRIIINFSAIILMTLVVFFLGEVFFRAFFPEYKDAVVAPGSIHGKKLFSAKLGEEGGTRVIVKDSSVTLNSGDHVVVVFGDSVTQGYGLAYEDVYWRYWQRMLTLEGVPVKLVANCSFGDNFRDIFDGISKTMAEYRRRKIVVEGIVYQVNLNDMIPYTRDDIVHLRHLVPQYGKGSRYGWLSKLIFITSELRWKILNRSVMFRVLTNKLTRLIYRNHGTCESLGLEAMGEYTYAYGAKGFEGASRELWVKFGGRLRAAKADLGDIPLVILLTPVLQSIDPELKAHFLSRPKRHDCATDDPVNRLADIARKAGAYFVDPTGYMKKALDNYLLEGNPELFYFLNDDNHFNAVGSKYFAEYSYARIFQSGMIGVAAKGQK